MWISEPMPVTTRIITADSGSSRSVKPALKSPDVIQVKTWLRRSRATPAAAPTSRHTAASDTANDADHRAARHRARTRPC